MGGNARPLLMFFAAKLVVDGVFLKFGFEFCNNAELTGVTNHKGGAACRS